MEGWRVQIPLLVKAYLEYQWHEQTDGLMDNPPLPPPLPPDSLSPFTMDMINLFCKYCNLPYIFRIHEPIRLLAHEFCTRLCAYFS